LTTTLGATKAGAFGADYEFFTTLMPTTASGPPTPVVIFGAGSGFPTDNGTLAGNTTSSAPANWHYGNLTLPITAFDQFSAGPLAGAPAPFDSGVYAYELATGTNVGDPSPQYRSLLSDRVVELLKDHSYTIAFNYGFIDHSLSDPNGGGGSISWQLAGNGEAIGDPSPGNNTGWLSYSKTFTNTIQGLGVEDGSSVTFIGITTGEIFLTNVTVTDNGKSGN